MLNLEPSPNSSLSTAAVSLRFGYFGHRSICWKCSIQASASWSTSTIGTTTQGELEFLVDVVGVFFFPFLGMILAQP